MYVCTEGAMNKWQWLCVACTKQPSPSGSSEKVNIIFRVQHNHWTNLHSVFLLSTYMYMWTYVCMYLASLFVCIQFEQLCYSKSRLHTLCPTYHLHTAVQCLCYLHFPAVVRLPQYTRLLWVESENHNYSNTLIVYKMHRNLPIHITATSSLWSQLWVELMGSCGQESKLDSDPVHFTSSNRIGTLATP